MDNDSTRQTNNTQYRQNAADIQHNLGLAYYSLQSGDRQANLKRAIAAYWNALSVYTLKD